VSDDLAIATTGLTRRFGDLTAVDGVDLRIPRGEVYGFLGPNGAGKSTVVRMLVTLLTPTSGSATVAGHDIVDEPNAVRVRIGVALQEASLDDGQTGREILTTQARLYGLSDREVAEQVDRALTLVDIGDAIDRYVGTYSGGMKRRLDLAGSLVHQPEVLFLDEPTTGLDPVSRQQVWEEVRGLNRELGMTIFLTTQYLEEADALAERIGIIAAGEVVAEGAPAELKRRIGEDLVVVQVADGERALDVLRDGGLGEVERTDGEVRVAVEDGPSTVGRVVTALTDAGIEVQQLTLRTPTLDDVFLDLTGNRLRATAADDEGDQT
jgi:ABC-2 type transport system ATP-binding protein